MIANAAIGLALLLTMSSVVAAQYPTLSRGVLTSPEVGDVEGIQRFGEVLRTDPDPGVGFTYRVLPPVSPGGMDSQTMVWALAHLQEAYQLKQAYVTLANLQLERQKATDPTVTQQLDAKIQATSADIARLNLVLQLALGNGNASKQYSRYATPNNPTAGLRTPFSSTSRDSLGLTGLNGQSTAPPAMDLLGASQSGSLSTKPTETETEIVHQPLIQIKVRIVEASRANSAGFRSVLDYISRNGTPSLVKGANGAVNNVNINGDKRSTRARTRLPLPPGTIAETSANADDAQKKNFGRLSQVTNSGTLVNLTSEHINYITNILVTDFRGDVVTVPEVVTLNGQNVEFVAGDNRPLPLGLTLVQSTGTVKQDVFYKHIGTLMSITPRIVNWGKYLEGGAEAPIVAQEINDWNRLADWMTDDRVIRIINAGNTSGGNDENENSKLRAKLVGYARSATPVPIEDKIAMLDQLEKYSPLAIRRQLWDFDRSILRVPDGQACDWKPEDCTIDLEVMMRESQIQGDGVSEGENAIANVVQVKSGHGVVMGGLIGAREIETISKVPLLGDVPVVGYFFRSTVVDRAKTELIILIEATVLPNPDAAREQTAQDFRLAHDYVSGSLRDNPLEVGMHRAGFGPYLPQAGPRESEFWAKHGNRMRKVATEADDLFH